MKVISFLRNKIVVGVMLFAFVVSACFLNCDLVFASQLVTHASFISNQYNISIELNDYNSDADVVALGSYFLGTDTTQCIINLSFVSTSSFSFTATVTDSNGVVSSFTKSSQYLSSYGYYIGGVSQTTSSPLEYYSFHCPSVRKSDVWKNQLYYQALYANFIGGDTSGFEFGSFDSDSATYDANLGSLKNVFAKQWHVDGSQYGDDYLPALKVTFANSTTSNFDLTQDGADVQYALRFFNTKNDSVYLTDYFYVSKNDFGSEDMVSNLKAAVLYILTSESSGLYMQELENAKNSFGWKWTDFAYSIDFDLWMRPVYYDGTDSSYGLWTKIFCTKGGGLMTVTDEDYTIQIDDGVSSESSVPSDGKLDSVTNSSSQSGSVGSGTSNSSAESSTSQSGNMPDVSFDTTQLTSALDQFKNSISAFTSLVTSVLSFLPPWVTTFIIACIIITGIMIVKRAIF